MPKINSEKSENEENEENERERESERKKVVIVAVVREDYDASKGFSVFVSELRKKYSDVLGTKQISLMVV